MTRPMSYAAITPARDEADNLRRLGDCMLRQSLSPDCWIVVDDGSRDATLEIMGELSRRAPWIRAIQSPSDRGGGIEHGRSGGRDVLAFNAGIDALPYEPEFLCKLDADVSLEPDYFERLLGRFADDPTLGIASGLCYEEEHGEWVPKHMTAGHVRGAARVWRRECFDQVRPLRARLGWDGIDELEANVRGWRTVSFCDIPIRHHRPHGARDGNARAWIQEGDIAHFMAYRPSYVLFRTLHHARREPVALAMLWGYAAAGLRRQPRYEGVAATRHLRRRQRLRELPRRRREVAGRGEITDGFS
jgi:glycosyltransferase involved in cell wall biosynthesis